MAMTDERPAIPPDGLLDRDGPWSFYESDHEVGKYVERIRTFLLPNLRRLGAERVLEVGCGSGRGTVFLREQGLDAWGVDPHFRDDVSADYSYLERGSGQALPFETRDFDVSFALEVIEHVGTSDGKLALAPDFQLQRESFVAEMCRVTRHSVIITTPNRLFPVDEHAADRSGSPGFRFHSPTERATVTVGHLERMFRPHGYSLAELLDPTGYYAMERIQRKLGRPGVVASRALLALSTNRILARTPFNPHLFLRFGRR